MAAREAEDRTRHEMFDSKTHEIRNLPYYNEIHHELSLFTVDFTLLSFFYVK